MGISFYFIGDTPQRGVYSDENNGSVAYISSGTGFVRGHFPQCDTTERIYPKQQRGDFERDERLSLRIFKREEFAIADRDIQEFLDEKDYVYRLADARIDSTMPYLEQIESLDIDTEEDISETKVAIVWTRNSLSNSVPPKADYYVWVVTQTLPDPDYIKKLDGKKIVIIQGDTLREYGADISKSLSWEETALDTVREYQQNTTLRDALRFVDLLIIPFGLEGAVVLNPGETSKAEYRNTLWFRPTKMEGDIFSEYPGIVPEAFEMFVTLTTETIRNALTNSSDVFEAIENNMRIILAGSMATHILGYNNESRLNLNCNDIGRGLYPLDRYLEIQFPRIDFCFISKPIPNRNKLWEIPPDVNMFKNDTSFLANVDKLRRIVEQGAINANLDCPILKIGAFESIGRKEIEMYSSMKILINNYLNTPVQDKPLSIAVFGKPGSGKSTCVKEIVKSILGEDAPLLEYNLSQFEDIRASSLHKPFQDIRDWTVKNKVPLVFFDEFDSHELDWLKLFLMPMQDGEFSENGIGRPLGKCILVFAGGINYSLGALHTYIAENEETARKKKVPDFLSRIQGHIDVLGINPNESDVASEEIRDNQDYKYVIRRAIMLHSMINRIMIATKRKIHLSNDVLRALLYIGKYENDARSMESILRMSKVSSGGILDINSMPSNNQLKLHVDTMDFQSKLRDRNHWGEMIGRMARGYAWSDGHYWEKLISEKQNHYYREAENNLYYLFQALNLHIKLCGGTGKVDVGDTSGLVLLSNYGDFQAISTEELCALAKRLYDFRIENENNNLPKWDQLSDEETLQLIEEMRRMLKPFDDNPLDTSIYLLDLDRITDNCAVTNNG